MRKKYFCQNKRVVGNHCVKTKVCGRQQNGNEKKKWRLFSVIWIAQVLDETVFTVLLVNYFNQHDQLDKPSFRFHVHILTSCYNFFNPYGNQVVHPLKRSDHIEAIECQSSLFCVICFWNIGLTHLFFKTACITYIIIRL